MREKKKNVWPIVFDSGYHYELYKDINTNFIQRSYTGSTQKLAFEIRTILSSRIFLYPSFYLHPI